MEQWTTRDFFDTRNLHGEGDLRRIFVQMGRVPEDGICYIEIHGSRAAAVEDAIARLHAAIVAGETVELTVEQGDGR